MTPCEIQSSFFARQVIGALKGDAIEQLTLCRNACDWGCATGAGTAELARTFHWMRWFGVDVEASSILTARKYAIDNNLAIVFNQSPKTPTMPFQMFDLVFSSNVLEHVDSPRLWLDCMAGFASRILIIMVPWREGEDGHPLVPGHMHSFNEESFPQPRAPWRRLQFTLLPPSDQWGGDQALWVWLNPGPVVGMALTDTDEEGFTWVQVSGFSNAMPLP